MGGKCFKNYSTVSQCHEKHNCALKLMLNTLQILEYQFPLFFFLTYKTDHFNVSNEKVGKCRRMSREHLIDNMDKILCLL